MSNFIVEEERGTYTGRRHPNNGYYALTGPTTRTFGPWRSTTTDLPNCSGHLAVVTGHPQA